MKFILLVILGLLILNLIAFEPYFMTDPAISPDGKWVCFSYMEDLWLVSSSGGEAKRLTVARGNAAHPVFSPDGNDIIFNSNRDGWSSIYRIPAQGGLAELICKEPFTVLDCFPDKSILANSWLPGTGQAFYRVNLDGSYHLITEFGGAYGGVDRSGKKIIFSRRGDPYRPAYQGSDNGDIWEYDIPKNSFRRITNTNITERYPQYTKKGDVFAAVSDGEVFQLYKLYNDFQKKEKLTDVKDWSVRDISVASQTDDVVFELFAEIWLYKAENKKAKKLEIEIKQDFLDNFTIRNEFHNKFDNYAVSDNGKLIVYSYQFDLFAVPAQKGEVKQLTRSQTGIQDIVIMDDNQTIFFTSYIDGTPIIFKTNITIPDKISKMKWSEDKYIRKLSKQNNQLLVYYHDKMKRFQLAIIDPENEKVLKVTENELVYHDANISYDFKYLFFVEMKPGLWSRHLKTFEINGGEKKQILDYYGQVGGLGWGTDGKTAFVTLSGKINRLDLLPKDDFFAEKDNWKEILEPDSTKSEKIKNEENKAPETKIEFGNIAQRVIEIIKTQGWNEIVFAKNDSLLYYLNVNDKKYQIRSANYLGEKDKHVYTFSGEPQNMFPHKKENAIYYIENEQLKKMNLTSAKVESFSNKFKYEFDEFRLNKAIFAQVWETFGRNFYDAKMHGINWQKMKQLFTPYLRYAFTPDMLEIIVNEMIGKVNASHTGFYPRKNKIEKTYSIAQTGMEFDLKNFPAKGIRIKKVYRNAKVNQPFAIKANDVLVAIDGVEIASDKNLSRYLADKVNEKIELTILSGKTEKKVTIKGLTFSQNFNLYYDNWVEERRQITEQISHNQIGYTHIRSMNWSSYEAFLQDIFANNFDKKALVIDVRNNGGGYTHDYLIEMLTKRHYAYNIWRETGEEKIKNPGNVWDKPVVLLINENSYSDAEIFPVLFQEFKLGKVVGMPTGGAVIGTGHVNFMDGSSMRMPSTGWFTLSEVNLENSGAMPDILVEPTPEHIIKDIDIQLERAIVELLKDL
jgi:C-terminal processing protease CtpA/Prc/Tol biopolymer transport system component